MSADNWAMCPICRNLPEEWRDGIDHLYGKISLEEFHQTEEKYKALQTETVREDYDIGLLDDGLVHVGYLGVCQNCGAEWEYQNNNIKRKGT